MVRFGALLGGSHGALVGLGLPACCVTLATYAVSSGFLAASRGSVRISGARLSAVGVFCGA